MAEASLMQLPVLATRSGSIEEVVIDQETGLLVESGNVGKLAGAMIHLAQDAELRKRLGAAGRNHITTHFSHQKIAEQFQRFFKQILS